MSTNTEVERDLLVVGAGPVGLLTALFAARAGLEVEVVDQEWRIAARSYACALHPRSVGFLDDFGVLPRALELGVRVETVAFYEGSERRAEVDLRRLTCRHPYVLVLYQDDLEGLLEDVLRERFGRKVGWGCRLEGLSWQEDSVKVVLERLQHAATGESAQRWTEVVDRRALRSSRYVVGADGGQSKLGHLLGIGSEQAGPPMRHAVYEFEPQTDAGREMRVAFSPGGAGIFWPLPGGTCRWSLPVAEADSGVGTSNSKTERGVLDAPVGAGGRRGLVERIREVAPWFEGGVRHLDWAMQIETPQRLVRQFGRGRCWMMGDAAHQAAPGGALSMNLAFVEAEELVEGIRRSLRDGSPVSALHEAGARWHANWRRRLGLEAAVATTASAPAWVRAHVDELVANLPAGGGDFAALISQLGLAEVA